MEKVLVDPELGEIIFRKNVRSRGINIRIHPLKGVSVSVPSLVPYAAAIVFFRSRRRQVLEAFAKQREKLKDVHLPTGEETEELRVRAKAELPVRLRELADRYGFSYNRVAIKNNTTNWGSCSVKNNINLNLNILRLPKALQDYVLLHELCHLRHHDHSHAFHLLLEHVLTDNILKLIDQGDSLAYELAQKAARSKAKYPLDQVITRQIKTCRLP